MPRLFNKLADTANGTRLALLVKDVQESTVIMRALAAPPKPDRAWQDFAFSHQQSGTTRGDDSGGPPNVLIADDQWEIREALRLLLKNAGYQAELVSSPKAVLERLRSERFDIVVLDLNYTRDTTSGREGLDLLGEIRRLNESLPVIVMTAWSNVELAVEAMRSGASDFIQKPWDNQHVLACLGEHVQRYRAERRQLRVFENERADAIATQRQLLSTYAERCSGYELASTYQPASTVGGDFFAVLQSERETALCVADVSGKGVPAALLMANLQAALKPLLDEGTPPARACRNLNRHVQGSGKLVSMFHAIFDHSNRHLRFANAGHAAPFVVHADGSHERLLDGGAVLGYFDEWDYQEGKVLLEPGSRLILFTDGMVDATDSTAAEFGEDRLVEVTRQNRYLNANALKNVLLDAVSTHCDGDFQDDATLLVMAVH
ncbi:MAG TPA: SpoIIE family protein phosphatase [Terriglobales bacterium]|jgi:sigma-B regulation protein RsbU (phosphoserine phosphatase)